MAGAGAGRRAALWHQAAPVSDNTAIHLGPGYRAVTAMSIAQKELRKGGRGRSRSRSLAVGQDARMPSQSQAKKDPPHNTSGSYGQWAQGLRNSLVGFSGSHAMNTSDSTVPPPPHASHHRQLQPKSYNPQMLLRWKGPMRSESDVMKLL